MKAQNNINQIKYYHNHKDKVLEKKRMYYQLNKEKIIQRNLDYQNRKKMENQEITVDPKAKPKKAPTDLTYFEILNVLRKENRHYLWGKCVSDWNNSDWTKFKILQKS